MKFFQNWRLRKPADDGESVYVSEKFGVRTLHIGSDTIQSAMRLARPNALEVAYTRSMTAFLLFLPRPRDVLMVGLGGGSLAKFLYHRLPHARTTVLEINPRVIAVARQFFHVPLDDDRLRIIVGDGAAFLEKGNLRADVIMLDGYDAEAQDEDLSTPAFYRNCARALEESGVLVVNLWGGDRNYDNCVARLRSAFNGLVACLPAGKPGNVVALAFKRSPGDPLWCDLQTRAQTLQKELELDFPEFVRELAKLNPHDAERLIL
jgi:spermidine synthase